MVSNGRQSMMQIIQREGYVLEQNVDVPLKTASTDNIIRANLYRPKEDGQYPVIVTYGPCKSRRLGEICCTNSTDRWERYSLLKVSCFVLDGKREP